MCVCVRSCNHRILRKFNRTTGVHYLVSLLKYLICFVSIELAIKMTLENVHTQAHPLYVGMFSVYCEPSFITIEQWFRLQCWQITVFIWSFRLNAIAPRSLYSNEMIWHIDVPKWQETHRLFIYYLSTSEYESSAAVCVQNKRVHIPCNSI